MHSLKTRYVSKRKKFKLPKRSAKLKKSMQMILQAKKIKLKLFSHHIQEVLEPDQIAVNQDLP
jgi:hypothetical protein